MIKFALIFLLMLTTLNAKKDFFYSFIDKDKSQISEFRKEKILSSQYKLDVIKRLVREGQLDRAYRQIVKFKDSNKLKIMRSGIDILFAEILYKRGGARNGRKAVTLLEEGINNSVFKKEDLLSAYRLLVVLTLNVNKPKDAKFYAKTIGKTFDNPLSKAYGQIALAQIAMHKRQYKKAIKILYSILVTTKNIDVATVVADELYDVYVLDHQDEKAYELAGKVLKKNINFYANDSFLALKKVEKLVNAGMPNFAVDILKMLLENAVEPESIDRFKFKLANIYMDMAGDEPKYMSMAKELYKDLMAYKKSPYKKQIMIVIDEILMREGKIEPAQVAKRYINSESMEQKVLMQELLNASKDHKYAQIKKMHKIYSKLSDTTTQRFGYENIQEVFDIINSHMIKFYLDNEKCQELSEVISLVNDESLEELVKDKNSSVKLFDCLTQIPDKRSYEVAKRALGGSRNADIYFALEQIAILLDKVDDAYSYVQKIDMLDNTEVKKKEFLYRFLVYGKLNNATSMDQFFRYTSKYPEYVEANVDNPIIIDFYYQYYLYLQKQNDERKALEILNKLYLKQKEMGAYVYSPFVDLELLKEAKLDEKYEYALELLQDTIKNTRSITDNELANVYYEMAKLYEQLGKMARYKKTIEECQELKEADNFYKKMCDKL